MTDQAPFYPDEPAPLPCGCVYCGRSCAAYRALHAEASQALAGGEMGEFRRLCGAMRAHLAGEE
jgi:hypothetical protein